MAWRSPVPLRQTTGNRPDRSRCPSPAVTWRRRPWPHGHPRTAAADQRRTPALAARRAAAAGCAGDAPADAGRAQYADDGRLLEGRHDLDRDAREAMAAALLTLEFPGGDRTLGPVPHLLDSGPHDQQFVAEVGNDGSAILRFGDDQHAGVPSAPSAPRRATASATAGGQHRRRRPRARGGANGRGARGPARSGRRPGGLCGGGARGPAASARLGTDAETIEEVRQLAPEAFRAIQFRAVTESDWQEVARDTRRSPPRRRVSGGPARGTPYSWPFIRSMRRASSVFPEAARRLRRPSPPA